MTRSIVTQVAVAATAIAVAVAAGAAVISFLVASARIEEAVARQLDARASVYAAQIGSELKNLSAHLAANAENTLFANALADSAGRDRYLLPYLKSLVRIGKLPVAVVLADYLGRPVAANAGAERAPIDSAALRQVVESGAATAMIDHHGENVLVTWIAPVLYANTGAAEGALAYQVSMTAIAAEVLREPGSDGFSLTVIHPDGKTQGARLDGPEPPARHLLRRAAVPLPGALAPWRLSVDVWEEVAAIEEARVRLAYAYLTVAGLAALIVFPLSLALARGLLRRLRALEVTARDVVATGAHHRRFAIDGNDEIASLGQAFNHMLAELQRAYDELKEESRREILQQGERYQRILTATPTGYARIDVTTARVEEVNDAFCRLFGQMREKLVGHAVPPVLVRLVHAAQRPGAPASWFDELATGDGLPMRQALVNCCLDRDSAGHSQLIVFVSDITARQDSEDRLRDANLQLEASVNALRMRDRELTIINRINDLLMACQSTEDAFKVLRAMASELLPGSSGGLAVLDGAGGMLKTRVTWGEAAAIAPQFLISDCWAVRQGRPHEIGVATTDLVCGHVMEQLPGASLCVPLMVQGTMLGLLWVGFGVDSSRNLDSQKQLALSLGDSAKLALSNLQLRMALLDQVILDPLTELHNRRHLEAVMPIEIARAARSRRPFSLAVIDLDHFKRINDSHGHDGGDKVLRAFAHLLKTALRRSDLSFRYGGEEFLVLLPDTDLAGAESCLEALARRWRSTRIRHRGHEIAQLTMSIGIAQFPLHGHEAEALIHAADTAVYAAKMEGRDCIRCAPMPEPQPAVDEPASVRAINAA